MVQKRYAKKPPTRAELEAMARKVLKLPEPTTMSLWKPGDPVQQIGRSGVAAAAVEERPRRYKLLADAPATSAAGLLYQQHLSVSCPACLMPEHTEARGWPVPCPALVASGVACGATAAAAERGHHWDCPYWDHTEETPF